MSEITAILPRTVGWCIYCGVPASIVHKVPGLVPIGPFCPECYAKFATSRGLFSGANP